jgi:hypothetical protein
VVALEEAPALCRRGAGSSRAHRLVRLRSIVTGSDYFTRLNPTSTPRRLIAQLERFGHAVTLTKATA